MKQLTILFALISFSASTQTWQTIPHEHYNVNLYSGGFMPSTNYSQFEINPVDGSMWFINNLLPIDFNIKRINTDGSMTIFDTSNNPFMDVNSRYNYSIEFISSDAYVLHGFDGVYRCTDLTWSTAAVGVDEGLEMCSDGDSLFIARQDQDFLSIKDGVTAFENFDIFERIRSRSGNLWGSGTPSSSIAKYISSTSSIQTFDPNTTPLLDNSNHDFKFARNSDTLYVAGEQGFSLAFEDQFYDTITMNNSTNMPYPSIIEFEFDSQDNIWAVFGDGGAQDFYPIYIGYFDRSTDNWSIIYDVNTCPVDFTRRIDIEIDLNDNLWVCDGSDLHVLKINTTPGWLSIMEEDQQQFSVFPNPSNGLISIQSDIDASDIEILDVTGRIIESRPFFSEIFIERQGTYVIRLLNQEGPIGHQKIVIE